MRHSLKTLIFIFSRYRWHLLILAAVGFLSATLESIGINAAIPMVSFLINGASEATDFITTAIQKLFFFLNIPFSFRYLLGFILILFILRAVAVVVFGYVRGWIRADFLGKESEDVMSRTLRTAWPFLLKQKIGAVHNTLVRDIQCTGGLLDVSGQIIQSFVGFLVYFLVALNISPLMTLYALGGGAILFFVLRPLLRRTRMIAEKASAIEKKFSQFLSEHIIGMKSIKAAGVEDLAISKGSEQVRLLRSFSVRQTLVHSIGGSLFQPASLILVAILFVMTYRSPDFNVISFAAALYLIQKIFTYLESGQNALQSMSALLPYTQNILAFKSQLDTHRETALSEGGSPTFKNKLAFKEVSFAYSDDKKVLNSISFDIEVGKIVGLIGPSGAGKTSIADLLLRLFKPVTGEIMVDDVPIESMSLNDWRQNIGYVPQDAFLFHDTIEENIRFYSRSLTTDNIQTAAKQANIHDFILGLPNGYQTIVGDRGVMLSGGQRQRIVLARALAAKPKLLILDEATSALDHESEKLIQGAIAKLRGVVTVLIIAHRPSTVAEADNILVLNRGQIVEKGNPRELLKNPDSYFSKMQHGR